MQKVFFVIFLTPGSKISEFLHPSKPACFNCFIADHDKMRPMKKFKTTAEKRQIQEANLAEMLAEKNLLRNSFINYAQVPLGLALTVPTLAVSWLSGIAMPSLAAVLFVYFTISAVGYFYMLQARNSFLRHRAQLEQTRNSFVGSIVPPALFGGLMLFIAAVLGLKPLILAVVMLIAAASFHAYALRLTSAFAALLPAIYLALPLGLPLLLPEGRPLPAALAVLAVSTVILASLALRMGKVLHLNPVHPGLKSAVSASGSVSS